MDLVPDWANLPAHLLDSVVRRLESIYDYVHFSVICVPWYHVAKDNRIQWAKMMPTAYNCPPFLLISANKEDTWNVYSPMHNKVLDFQLDLPDKILSGHSKGWLIAVEDNFSVTLINPFYRVKGRRNKETSIIRLPQLKSHFLQEEGRIQYEMHVYRATMTADPVLDADNCIVQVIYNGTHTMAFIRVGKDTRWTFLCQTQSNHVISDAVYFPDKFLQGPRFFVVGYSGYLSSFAIPAAHSDSDVAWCFHSVGEVGFVEGKTYLVDSNGEELLMVRRSVAFDEDLRIPITRRLEVFKYDYYQSKWIEKNTLGDAAIFMSGEAAICVSFKFSRM